MVNRTCKKGVQCKAWCAGAWCILIRSAIFMNLNMHYEGVRTPPVFLCFLYMKLR